MQNKLRGENMESDIENRIRELIDKGVTIIDPRQTYISGEVDPDRIYSGSVLHPGTRLTGGRTLIGSGAKIGSEGPAVIHDSIIGSEAEIASGFLTEATMLPRSRAGANSHYRAGTLLEEYSSTAHSVGLKQSILMYSVTLGSLINFCDVLISGGRSRDEHSEVGSGFIHFNFAPWGKNGNKATPSLIGSVTEGVFLDSDRIFLGGLSGMAGPVSVGFGALTPAGQVIRASVPESTTHSETGRSIDKKRSLAKYRLTEKHVRNVRDKNIEFITQLYALKEWYLSVRLERSRAAEASELILVITGAIETIMDCIEERIHRFNSFAGEWSVLPVHATAPDSELPKIPLVPDWKPELEHDEWIRQLSGTEKTSLRDWLEAIVLRVSDSLNGEGASPTRFAHGISDGLDPH